MADYDEVQRFIFDYAHFSGLYADNLEAITTRYPFLDTTRMTKEIIELNYNEYKEALLQICSEGRRLGMVQNYGSWNDPPNPRTKWTTSPAPTVAPRYHYSPPAPSRL